MAERSWGRFVGLSATYRFQIRNPRASTKYEPSGLESTIVSGINLYFFLHNQRRVAELQSEALRKVSDRHRNLVRQYGSDPTVTRIPDDLDLYVTPVFNADCYVYTWQSDDVISTSSDCQV
ncbi:metallocarboxypeptidase [Branchiostoma belcheri]|nr:metallocarboxypeptidase [Branchiostoma belcheri]KAI8482806.1 metallocarboxypeptidase [Branchiostoma belcheri]